MEGRDPGEPGAVLLDEDDDGGGGGGGSRGLDDTDAMDGEGGALAMTLTAEGAGAYTTRPLLSST